jgi:hypothetical protein
MVSPVHGDYRRCQAEIPLIVLCRFPGPALQPFPFCVIAIVNGVINKEPEITSKADCQHHPTKQYAAYEK